MAAAEAALVYHNTCDAKRATLGPVDVPRHADDFGVVFGARDAFFFADEKTLPSRGLFDQTIAYGHGDVRAAL